MPKFQIRVSIKQSIDIVYQAYIDPDNMLMWTSGLEKIVVKKGAFGEIGAIAHLHYNQNGRKSILEDKLKYIESGKKIISQVTGGGLSAEVSSIFTSLNGTTELTLIWDGKGKNILITIFLSLIRNRIKRSAKAELLQFKKLVEIYGTNFKK